MKTTMLASFQYDPLDRLTGTKSALQSNSLRFYCQSRIATEIQGAALHSIMQHGDQLLAQHSQEATHQTNTLLVTDSQRSVLHTMNNTEQQAIAYLPFGHHTTPSANTPLLGFNGERAEPLTGHYLLGNGYRAFNPILMRFNSPDTMSPFDKGGLNSYGYCLGNPVTRRDPSGHFSLKSIIISSLAGTGISAALTGMALAASTPRRFTSSTALGAYVFGSVSVVAGAVSIVARKTIIIGPMLAAGSAVAGTMALTLGVLAKRNARAAARRTTVTSGAQNVVNNMIQLSPRTSRADTLPSLLEEGIELATIKIDKLTKNATSIRESTA
ncbi:RHS repeat-associated core domain-containing protein [Pseudomonas psychrophila]|uniref:RHS repeat-associated core domain-containing protein n=1 Tax=Pseudomonas psychrophila TaxID=122355 RepID=UPI00030314EA|nr:RHS repeat-associated core domain-containing protein [Pseudomonas psychrophila]